MKRLALTLSLAAVALFAMAAPAAQAAAPAAPSSPDSVVQWNQFLLDLQGTSGAQPATTHPTYELAVMHAAIYDAVVSIHHSAPPYLGMVRAERPASVAAAADAAAHDALLALYPAQRATVDREYAALIAQVHAGPARSRGIAVGRRAARFILAKRGGDGSTAPAIGFQPSTAPGAYQATAPAFGPPVFTQWGAVRPFVLRKADRSRPSTPPALSSGKYAAAIGEVQALGAATGSTRTPDQTQIGQFWNAPIWATWNRIAEDAATAHHDALADDARSFAVLNLTLADSVIALYDAKYAYRLWRPITAIQHADADGNPATTADAAWSPLSATAPDPSYPGAHATVSAAAAAVLARFYGNDLAFTLTSPVLPGVARSFSSFSEAADEATVSRIYNGNHTRIDEAAGENLGHDVADFVLDHALRSLTEPVGR
jgi:membrane-associated phospholipid phosphatase